MNMLLAISNEAAQSNALGIAAFFKFFLGVMLLGLIIGVAVSCKKKTSGEAAEEAAVEKRLEDGLRRSPEVKELYGDPYAEEDFGEDGTHRAFKD